MTHDVLSHVVDDENPNVNRDGAERLLWHLAILPELHVMRLSCMYSCG